MRRHVCANMAAIENDGLVVMHDLNEQLCLKKTAPIYARQFNSVWPTDKCMRIHISISITFIGFRMSKNTLKHYANVLTPA